MLTIRPALANDVPLLHSLIDEFATFERDQAVATEENLLGDGFGPKPKFRALIAEWADEPVG
jgi:hypothetical protein